MVPKTLLTKLLPRKPASPAAAASPPQQPAPGKPEPASPEAGGPARPDPTRYGDWERNGRCIDF